ncbi:VOC family protein [Brevibacterium casei]|uniref:VOC family protein n=1 Tax=Brevibacterium casei TaxID=33889 RepID=A0A7T4A1P2_9MICO|nr:VOC family protein [Brevibacterium casei]QQB15674.1 VOC family protein [Brevibacterium casei]
MMLPATFDHLVIAVPDLAQSVEQCEAVLGVRPVPGGVHPGRGTANALLGLEFAGTRAERGYLELLGPDPEQNPDPAADTTAPDPTAPDPTAPALPPALAGVTAPLVQRWAIHPRGFDRAVTAAAEATDPPVDLGAVFDMSRRTPDGETLRWRLTRRTPLALGGIQPFLIDWLDTPHPASRAMPTVALAQFWATSPTVADTRAVLAALDARIEVEAGETDALHARLEGPGGTWLL